MNSSQTSLTRSRKDSLAGQHGVLTAFSCLLALLTMQTIGLAAPDGGCLNAGVKIGRVAGVLPRAASHVTLTGRFSQVAWVYRQILLRSGRVRLAGQSCLLPGDYHGHTATDLPTIFNHRQVSVLFALGLVAGPWPWPWHGAGFSKSACSCLNIPCNGKALACRAALPQLAAGPIILRATAHIRSRSQLAPPKSV